MKETCPEITINAHSSIRIAGSKVLYFDPYMMKETPHDADAVFITHSHFDHESPEDIDKVVKPGTVVVKPETAGEKVIDGITYETVPAYNLNKKFHPKENGWVGYRVTMDGKTYYVAGDTDATPELLSVKADVALLPAGGTYTMTAEEAAAAALQMDVPTFIPMHYGSVAGSPSDGETFRTLIGGRKNVVLKLFQ